MGSASLPKESSGMAWSRGRKRPLRESVKLKPRLPWGTQDIRDARVMRYLARKTYRE